MFKDAKSIFYYWWRKPKPLEPPVIMDMFADSKILSPNYDEKLFNKKWGEVSFMTF